MHDADYPTREPILSKSALQHLWSLEISPTTVLDGPLKVRWDFFNHAGMLPWNPQKEADRATRDLLTRALLAEVENPEPLEND